GLVVLNKPFGIKVYGHDKPGARSKTGQNNASSVPVCDFTVEDALPHLKNYLNVSNLSILKSAEKYTSGIMLLSADQKISDSVKRSFNIAKNRKLPHLIHWMLTLGYPVATYKKERVGIKFLEAGEGEIRQPVIVNDVSRRAVALKRIHPVLVEFRVLSTNPALPTSLVEIATSSVKFHFVRVYASDRIATILGDVLYSSRMNTLLGVPVKTQIQKTLSFDMQPLPEKIAKELGVPKGAAGHSMIPTMLHLRSIILPSFRGEDLTLTAELPMHFRWTTDKLHLLS
ncbi:mitochondrial RNA pseudouridine synthase Rpusd4-like, partial [Stegodyphus dumicola]|uniref:mitochondrial RNA pseudouridine synthase Rpusd4-like n=1 Tax=Stegodyphus dumicola TaxID=202533 RepID=UPI0015AE1C8E